MKLDNNVWEPGAAGRSPQGERGLKLNLRDKEAYNAGRSPQGERGLKLHVVYAVSQTRGSLPARGAWVETVPASVVNSTAGTSLPARGAWVETGLPDTCDARYLVAPRKGSVG